MPGPPLPRARCGRAPRSRRRTAQSESRASWRCQSSTFRAMLAKQRRYDPALGRADSRRLELAALHHSGPEKLLDQPQDVPVGHHLGQFAHHGLVAEIVEETGDVGIEHPTVPLPPQFQDLLHRLMTASSWPEAVRMIVKLGLEDRTQQTPKHLLSDPIPDCRNSQWAKLGLLGRLWECRHVERAGARMLLFSVPASAGRGSPPGAFRTSGC